jgi:hypothetical protein
MFILSDNKDFCMQNIALHAFFDSRSVAHRKEPDGLNMIPKYLYSEACPTDC